MGVIIKKQKIKHAKHV